MDGNIAPTFQEKPIQFKVLCILAFIFAGITLLYTIVFLLADVWQNGIREGLRVELFPESLRKMSAQIVSIIGFILAVFFFAGIIQIWNRIRVGFWVFSISIFLFLMLPFIVLEAPFLWLFRTQLLFIMIAVLFILLFGYNLKHMAKHSGQ